MGVRRPGASRLQVLGLMLVGAAAAAWAVTVTAADPARVAAAGEQLATSTVIRQHLTERIRDATAAALGTDPAALEVALEPAADRAVDDPRVREAFAAVAGVLAEQVLDGRSATVILDPVTTTAAMRDALVQVSPADAAALGPTARLEVRVGRPPDLSQPVRLVRTAWAPLLAAGGALATLGIALDPHRLRALARAGRWLTALGVAGLLGGVALPLALGPTSGWLGVLATVVGNDTPLLGPALAVGATGAGLVALAGHLERRLRHRTLRDLPRAGHRRLDTLER